MAPAWWFFLAVERQAGELASGGGHSRRQVVVQVARGVVADRPFTLDLALGRHPSLAEFYAADIASGRMPSKRQIKRDWPVGYATASDLHDHLTAAMAAT